MRLLLTLATLTLSVSMLAVPASAQEFDGAPSTERHPLLSLRLAIGR